MPLKLYRRGEVWHYRGTVGPAGRRRRMRGSCQTSDQDIAARQIAEIEAKYWQGHFDGPSAILTFGHAATLYRAAKGDDKYLRKVERRLSATLVRDINSGMLMQIAKEMYPACSGNSLNRLVQTPVSAVINHAAASNLCQPIRTKRFPVQSKVKDPATREWIEAFRAHAGPHLGTWVWFMFLTGARPGEAIAVQWDDLDLAAGTVLIRETKVGKERMAHLPRPLVVALANLERVKDRGVFVYMNAGDPSKAWDAVCRRAGIKRLTPHSCRHGFATGLLRRGVDVVTVAWLGGWESPQQVLKTYGHAIKDIRLTGVLLNDELTHNSHSDTPDADKLLRLNNKLV